VKDKLLEFEISRAPHQSEADFSEAPFTKMIKSLGERKIDALTKSMLLLVDDKVWARIKQVNTENAVRMKVWLGVLRSVFAELGLSTELSRRISLWSNSQVSPLARQLLEGKL